MAMGMATVVQQRRCPISLQSATNIEGWSSKMPQLRVDSRRRARIDGIRASAASAVTCSALTATCQTEQQTIQHKAAVVSKTAPSQSKEAFVPKLDDGGPDLPPGDGGDGGGGGGGGGWGAGGWCFWGLLLLLFFIKSNEGSSKRKKSRYRYAS